MLCYLHCDAFVVVRIKCLRTIICHFFLHLYVLKTTRVYEWIVTIPHLWMRFFRSMQKNEIIMIIKWPICIRKITIQSDWMQQPLAAAGIITAAKDEVRLGGMKSSKVRKRWRSGLDGWVKQAQDFRQGDRLFMSSVMTKVNGDLFCEAEVCYVSSRSYINNIILKTLQGSSLTGASCFGFFTQLCCFFVCFFFFRRT